MEPPAVHSWIPVLLFKDLWPALASHDVSAGIVSAFALAGAVYQIHAALRELGLRRAPRLLLTIGFGLNPMIIYTGQRDERGPTPSLSSPLPATCCGGSDRMTHGPWPHAAIALSLAYLDQQRGRGLGRGGRHPRPRHQLLTRSTGVRQRRIIEPAATDGALFLVPVVTTFTGWAVASLVIKGQPFAQFTSHTEIPVRSLTAARTTR